MAKIPLDSRENILKFMLSPRFNRQKSWTWHLMGSPINDKTMNQIREHFRSLYHKDPSLFSLQSASIDPNRKSLTLMNHPVTNHTVSQSRDSIEDFFRIWEMWNGKS